jgi:hypothetical protein
MAAAESMSWGLLPIGAGLGVLAVVGVWFGMKSRGSQSYRLVSNPTRRLVGSSGYRRLRKYKPRWRKQHPGRPQSTKRIHAGTAMARTRSNPRRRKAAPRLTSKRRQILAIAHNAWSPGKRSASFINAHERATVKNLDELGWLKITKRGKSPGGRTEIYARITPAGSKALGAQSNPTYRTSRDAEHTHTVRVPNPLRSGYSRATVAANVAEMQRKGYPERQAVAASMRSARAAWRNKNPSGGFPAHLQTANERKGHKTAGRKARKNPAPKRATKTNPKRAKAGTPPKGDTARAKWIRKQMRNGRTKKQAAALWKGQQAMKQKRRANPKAKAGARRRRK